MLIAGARRDIIDFKGKKPVDTIDINVSSHFKEEL